MIYEDNLMWSVRLRNAAVALGHEATVCASASPPGDADCAILNLGFRGMEMAAGHCREAGVPILAHAGHKETELLDCGKRLGCDLIVTNGGLVPHLKSHLDQVIVRELEVKTVPD